MSGQNFPQNQSRSGQPAVSRTATRRRRLQQCPPRPITPTSCAASSPSSRSASTTAWCVPLQACRLSGEPVSARLQRIAVKQWGPESAPTKVLCLHGWLDKWVPARAVPLGPFGPCDPCSASTYDKLAPLLISTPKVSLRLGRCPNAARDHRPGPVSRAVCMDFSGHGLSSHRAKDAEYSLEARVLEVRPAPRGRST
jgi:hypothetical protein